MWTNACVLNSVKRTDCKRCRLEKCLSIGMRPERVDRVARKRGRVIATSAKNTRDVFEVDEAEDVENVRVAVSEATTSRNAPSDRGFSESYESTQTLDITSLVEECVVEEEWGTNLVEFNQNTVNNKWASKNISELTLEHVDAMKPASPNTSFHNTTFHNEPVFDFTFEEEFKIYELLVRKNYLVDAIFGLVSEIPQFKVLILNFLSSGELGCNGSSENILLRTEGHQAFKEVLGINLNPGGKIRACLDMFDEYKYVDEEVKIETFAFSIKTFHICSR